LNIPERYTREDASYSDKEIYEHYMKIIENLKASALTQRGKVFTFENGLEYTIWEEPEDEYLERVRLLEDF
jgi:hypothetical protein